MAEERKVFRTAAFRVNRDGEEHVVFWSIDPSYWNAPKVYIREHDLYLKGSMSKPITEEIPVRDALKQIAELEREAAAKYPVAAESHKEHRWIGDNFRNAPSWKEHPDLRTQQTEETVRRLRERKPPGFGLK